MPRWLARNPHGSAVVLAKNWLWALAAAQEDLGLPQEAYQSLFALQRDDGGLTVRVHGSDPVEMWPMRDDDDEAAVLERAQPDVHRLDLGKAPASTTGELARWVHAIVGAPTELAAAHRALQATDALIGSESASVLRAEPAGLRFVAARGPHSEGLTAYTLDKGRGVAGFVHQTGRAVLFNDLTQSGTHLHALDDETGYRPTALLAVPIGDEAGYDGVLELLNTEVLFEPWQIDVARAVGTALSRSWRGA